MTALIEYLTVILEYINFSIFNGRVEPALQPLDHEPLQYATANWVDGAQLDVVAWDFWGWN